VPLPVLYKRPAARTVRGAPRTPVRQGWGPIGLPLALGWLGMATIGLNVVRIGGYPLSDFIFLAMAGVMFAKLLVGDESGLAPPSARRSSQYVMLGSIVLLTAGVLSSFHSWNPDESLAVVARLGYVTLLWFWMLRAVTPTRRALNVLLSGWRAGVMLIAVVTILAEAGVLKIGIDNPEERQTAFSTHPNNLAGYLLVGLPLLIMCLPRRPHHTRQRQSLVRLVCVGMVMYAITTTGSMTGFLAAVLAVVVTITTTLLIPPVDSERRRVHPVAVMAGALVVALGVGLLATSDLPVVERFQRLEEGDSGVTTSANHRGRLNAAVLDRFDDWLIVGVGLDHASVYASGITNDVTVTGSVHNMYLKVLFEAGLPALIGLMIILGATVRAALMLVVNTRDTELYPVAVAALASTIASCTFAFFGPILFERYFWLPVSIVWCLWALRREEIRRAREASVVRPPAGPPPLAALPPAPAGGAPTGPG
jgi:O-antigen ligase